MLAEDIVLAVSKALDQSGIRYMVVGAFVGIYYGIQRTTEDADFLLGVQTIDLTPLKNALGDGFTIDPQSRFESITMGTYYVAHHKDSDFGIDLFLLQEDRHDQLSFERRRLIAFDKGQAWIPTAEDFVITKLRWSKSGLRSKDIEDVRSVLAVQQGKLDMEYIRQWCSRHGTLELMETTLASIPPLPPV